MVHAILPTIAALGLAASLGFAAVGLVMAVAVIARLVRESRQNRPSSDDASDGEETNTEHSDDASV
jgi:uncharacterized membrane protein YhiD involved in acid resistance